MSEEKSKQTDDLHIDEAQEFDPTLEAEIKVKPKRKYTKKAKAEVIELASPDPKQYTKKKVKTVMVPKTEAANYIKSVNESEGNLVAEIQDLGTLGRNQQIGDGDASKVAVNVSKVLPLDKQYFKAIGKVKNVETGEVEWTYVTDQKIPLVDPQPVVNSDSLIAEMKRLVPRESLQNLRRAIDVHNRGGTVGISSSKGLIVIPTLQPAKGGIDRLKRMPNVIYILADRANS